MSPRFITLPSGERIRVDGRDEIVGQLHVQLTVSPHGERQKMKAKSFISDIFSRIPLLCVNERGSGERRSYFVLSFPTFSLNHTLPAAEVIP